MADMCPTRRYSDRPGPGVAVGQAASEAAADIGTSQIGELVRRIDKYQSTRGQPAAPRAPRAAFLFETGPDGVIHWVDGVTRGTVIGLSIAEAAFGGEPRSEEHTSELQSLMRISYAVFCLKKKKKHQ